MDHRRTRGGTCRQVVLLLLLVAGGPSATAPGAEPSTRPAEARHLIPADKKLSPEWLAGLSEGRQRQAWSGKDAATIGMPVGGIAAGQLYLRGDGTLGAWKIFNTDVFTGFGQDCYKTEVPESPVESGFAVVVEAGGTTSVRPLSREGFPSCEFLGEYPVGLVRYADKGCPVRVEMEAFSPFIPLDARDSSLPATLFHVTVENTSDKPVAASLLGWLENAVCRGEAINLGAIGWREQTMCRDPETEFAANRRSRIVTERGRTMLVHGIEPARPHPDRPPILFEDFEREDYGKWKVEGKAFGQGPTKGAVLWQRKLDGWVGQRLANSFLVVHDENGQVDREASLGGRATGSLTSPEFQIERDYITFYIGKGDQAGKTCINLLIDGKVVRSSTGSANGKWNLLKDSLLWNFWDVRELTGKTARIQILDAAEKGEHSNQRSEVCVDHIIFCDIGGLRGAGTMVLALDGPPADAAPLLKAAEALPKDLHAETNAAYPAKERRCGTVASEGVRLAPGEKHTFTFALSWFFPNHRDGRHYANRFHSAEQVAAYVLDNHDRLAGGTRLWHKTFYEDSTLPRWLLFRLHAPVANLATGTVLWWGNGRVWGWEGVGCCGGTCTHVYNYAQAHACLFPELARTVRQMQDFGAGFHEDSGLVGFRSGGAYAADGQCGTVLKAYREHRMSADSSFLKRNWAHIRKALAYAIEQDGNDDGLIENRQHNTYDVDFYGANTFVGSLYLAALRAGEEMATEMDDREFAARCRKLYESGRRLTMAQLWNGEYFVQKVDLGKYERHQYAEGCLADQLFGQGWAHLLGLGHLYPKQAVRKAYESIWKYNWAPSVEPYNKVHRPGRVFARGSDAGLFTCTWPQTPYLEGGVSYKNEVWTGIEYEVAGGMIWEGMVEEGLAICRGVHERYHPSRHNPFNEVECGDHYARALASWGVYHALLGYEYDGPSRHIGFAPRLSPGDFAAAFTAAEGWGLFRQTRRDGKQMDAIQIRYGKLPVRTVALDVPEGAAAGEVEAAVDGKPVRVSAQRQGNRLLLTLEPVTLTENQSLRIAVK